MPNTVHDMAPRVTQNKNPTQLIFQSVTFKGQRTIQTSMHGVTSNPTTWEVKAVAKDYLSLDTQLLS